VAGQGTGLAAVAAGAGALLVWSGVRGTSVTGALRELLAGRPPSGLEAYPLSTGQDQAGTAGVTGAAGSAAGLAGIALASQGHPYLYGGAPGPNGTRPWDCSSSSSWWLHEAGLPVPGGQWAAVTNNGNSHGPTTLSYLAWSQARTVGHDPSAAQASDLCVWQTHMGVALGGGQMISALNPQLGTKVTSISGAAPFGEFLSVRRIVAGPASAQPGKTALGGF
jgi:cell wall-associated NlpC family hydrolase